MSYHLLMLEAEDELSYRSEWSVIPVPGEAIDTKGGIAGPGDDFKLVRIHLTVPRQFLNKIDKQAINHLMTRSDYIRMSLMEKMNITSLFEDELDKLYRHPE